MRRRRFWLWLALAVAVVGTGVVVWRTPWIEMPPRARERVLVSELRTMRDCIAQFHGDKGRHPSNLAELVETGYLYRLPTDPITGRSDTWTMLLAPAGAFRTAGVVDVHSGSQARGSDGRAYSEW